MGERGRIHERLGASRVREERFDLMPQRVVAGARLAQKCRALSFVARERVVIELFDVEPAIRTRHR
jgi:hypothetical protein